MSKVTPKISKPPAPKMPTKGPHNPNVGTHGGGGALAKPGRSVGMGDSGMRIPVQSPKANISSQRIGQKNPDTTAAATSKPKSRNLDAFYGRLGGGY